MHYLILGGGSAGCVLAARLSENARHRVTLVEAGPDVTAETMHPHVRSRYPGRAYLDPGNVWPRLEAKFGAGGAPRLYQQARMLGGGSSINAMVANRGAPADYNEWGAMGAEGWSFEAALPYFRKLERDVDFLGQYHGSDGPLPVRRISSGRMSPFVKALWATLEAQGYEPRADQNGTWEDGLYIGAVAVSDSGERVPTAVAYLPPEVRARKTLEIVTGVLAERVTFEGRRATGAIVSPLEGGPARTIAADTVIVSSGAIHSPSLLMRSGIGPGATLRRHGIEVVAAREGVGANLMEHPSTAVSTYLPPAMRLSDLGEHHDHAILRFTSSIANAPRGDMHLAMIARSGWHSIGQRIGTLFIWVNKPYSRGAVTLASADPRAEPGVDFRLLSDERDLERLKEGFRVGAGALTDASMADRTGPAFPTSYSKRVAAIGAPGAFNTLQRGLFAAMLDGAGRLRPALIHGLVTLGTRLDDLLADDDALTSFVLGSVGGVWHASGTCRMGGADDAMAVTDGAGRVHGTEGLMVCDASLMPSIPRANTNVPTIMLAERIADLVKAAGQGV
jgi:5-(hydroxymethyl)furfural/furfural oxidase